MKLVQHFAQGPHHDFVWGADYRFASDHTVGSLNISFNPANRSTNFYGVLVQDEITLLPDKLHVTAGAKLEHNYYSGFAVQPNIRALWTVHPHYTMWAAISGAAENSSRFDAYIRTNNDAFVDPNGVLTLQSNFDTHHLPSENVVAFELGQRGQVSNWLACDVDVFYNRYSHRHTHEPVAPFFEDDPSPTHLLLPSVTLSRINGETHGLEVEKRGHTVTVAANGKEALVAVAANASQLVFMDMQMPEMDGFEATAAIREREKHSGTHGPIVAMTAHAMVGDKERSQAAGMDDYLSKPIRPEELNEVLKRYSSAEAPVLKGV